MNDHKHVTIRNVAKQRISLTRRQFLGIMGIFGAGTGAVCGGVTAMSLSAVRANHTPTPTDSPTPVPATAVPQVEKPPIVDRTSWGALSPDINARNEHGYYDKLTNPEGWYVYPDTLKESYQTLVIHHSSFYEEDGYSTLLEIQRAHREDRGWADVAYHYIVDKDGTIYEGREMTVRGAHVAGFNTGSLGVCLMGNFTIESPTEAQLTATYALNAWLVFRLELTHLAGHQQFNDWTQCPGTFLNAHLDEMATRTGLTRGTDGYIPTLKHMEPCGCCACQL